MIKIFNLALFISVMSNFYGQCLVTFDSIPPLCQNSIAPILPTTSTNGITGTWNTSVSTASVGVFDYIFTPEVSSGCSPKTISIKINPLPTVTASASEATICAGESVTLTGDGALSYTWDNSVINNIAFVPTSTKTYTVTGTNSYGCQNMATVTVTVNQLPTVTASTSQSTVCAGQSVILSGGGAQTYTWNNGVSNGIAFVPTSTMTYTVTGTNSNGCQNTATVIVTVNQLPTVTASISQSTICLGQSVTLTGGGALFYTWDNNVINNIAFVPTSTKTYNVTGTNSNGCQNIATVTVTVNQLPTVTASTSQSTICLGQSVILSGGGAQTYTWNNGVSNGIAFVPTSTTTYTVTGTNSNGCQNIATVTVTVNQLPTVTASTSQSAVCAGQSVILSGGGAQTYTWNNGVSNGIAFVPTSTKTYTVTGTNSNGCQNNALITVTVNPLPNTNAGTDQTVCAGTAISLMASGADTYQWNNFVNNNVAFVPTSTVNYSVIGTNSATGCFKVDSVKVTVNLLPIINAGMDMEICEGSTISLTATGAISYAWSNNVINDVPFSPSVTNGYFVTGYNQFGCSSTDQLMVIVKPRPVANAGSDFSKTCIQNVSGMAIGSTSIVGNSYSWFPATGLSSTTVSNPIANPTASTLYTLTVTALNGCSSNDQAQVTVENQIPIANAGNDFTKTCIQHVNGLSIGQNNNNLMTYSWTPAAGLNSSFISNPLANPEVTTTFNLTVTNTQNGCSSSDQVIVTVDNQLPLANAGSDFTKTCVQNLAGVSVGSSSAIGNSYLWIPATGLSSTTVSNPIANPTISTLYTLTVTGANGCISSDQVHVTVDNQAPTANAGNDFTKTCQQHINGNTIGSNSLTGYLYSWSPNIGLSAATVSNPIANPSITTAYTLSVIAPNGCLATDQMIVTVDNQSPIANAGSDVTICINENSILNGSGGANYSWSPVGTLSQSNVSNPVATPNQSTIYTLTVTNSNGCVDSDDVLVTVQETPFLNLGSNLTVCKGEIVNFTSSNIEDDEIWGGLALNLTGETISFEANQTGYVVCSITDDFGCFNKDSVQVIVNQLPVFNIDGTTTACQNSHWTHYSVSPTSNVLSWSIDNGEITSGTGMEEIEVRWNYGITGNVTLIQTDNNGCQGFDTLAVNLSGLALDQASVYRLNPTSSVLYADTVYPIMNWGYESIVNRIPVYQNVQTQYCEYSQIDDVNYYYWVEIGTNSECLTKSYYKQPQVVASTPEHKLVDLINVFPNPTTDYLIINLSEFGTDEINYRVFDVTGKTFKSGTLKSGKNLIDTYWLENSIYFIDFQSTDDSFSIKFIKI